MSYRIEFPHPDDVSDWNNLYSDDEEETHRPPPISTIEYDEKPSVNVQEFIDRWIPMDPMEGTQFKTELKALLSGDTT